MEQPTLSPQTNKLLEICNGIFNRTNSPDELAEHLDEMFAGVEKAKKDFVEKVQNNGPEYIAKVENEMNLALQSFDNFSAALEQIEYYLQDNKADTLKNGMEMIVGATNQVLNAVALYEAKVVTIGPTRFPILNLLIILSDGFKKGNIPEDEFRFMIYNAGQFFNKLVDEAENAKAGQAQAAVDMLKEGYVKFLDGLEMLDDGAKAHNDLMLDEGLGVIRESQEIINRGYEKFNDDMFMDGPTESPFANVIIATIKGVKENVYPKELLAENLEKYEEEMESLRMDIEGIAAVAHDNQEIDDELPRTIKSLDLSDEACKMIKTFLKNGDFSLLDSAILKLTESAGYLKESQTKYEKISEKEGKIACFKCGTLNEPNANMCIKCGIVLPKISQGSGPVSTIAFGEEGQVGFGATGEFVMTQNVKKIVDDSARVRDGRITFEEYSKTLDWMENLVEKGLEDIGSIPAINISDVTADQKKEFEEFKRLAEEGLDLLREGLEGMLEGLDSLRMFGEDKNVEHLRTGIEIIIESSMKMNQVQKMGDAINADIAQANMAQEFEDSEPSEESEEEGGIEEDEEFEDEEIDEEEYGTEL